MICWKRLVYINGLLVYVIVQVVFFLWTHDRVLQRRSSLISYINRRVKTPSGNISKTDLINSSSGVNFTLHLHDLLGIRIDVVPIVIVTYMRSGSSLTGDILQQEPNSFYLFEPFRNLQNCIDKKKPMVLPDGTNKTVKQEDFTNTAKNIFRNLVACEVNDVPRSLLTDSFLNAGIKSRQYSMCLIRLRNFPNHDRFGICNSLLMTNCKESKFRIFKTIRLSIVFFTTFLEEFPSLKIIHLLRDPRATLNSQLRSAVFKMSNTTTAAKKLCTRMIKDNWVFRTIQRTHPVSIMRLYYEHLAEKPIEISQKLYKFLGMDYSKHIQEYVFNITSRGLPDGCPICSQRSNSKEHISAWRNKMSFKMVTHIDNECREVYEQLRYISVPTEVALKNLRFLLFKHY